MMHPDTVVMGDLNLVRAVGMAGLSVLVISNKHRIRYSRYCSRFVTITPPVVDMARAADELCELGKTLRSRPVLYYSNDAQLLMVSRHRERLELYFRFRLPDPDVVEDLVDKTRFQEAAKRYDLPVPRSEWNPTGDPDANRIWNRFPAVIKPVSRVGWFESSMIREMAEVPHKVIKVCDPEELRTWTARMKSHHRPYLIQEYIAGGDDQIYSFHGYYNAKSDPLVWFVGRKVRTYPPETGRSTCLELVEQSQVLDLGRAVLKPFRFRGVVKVDFKRDPETGRFYLLEINPRFNIWHYLGTACGVNLPAAAYAELMEKDVVWNGCWKTGVRWVSFRADLKSAQAGIRSGAWSAGRWVASYLRPKVYNSFAWNDPGPLFYAAFHAVGKRLRAIWLGRKRTDR